MSDEHRVVLVGHCVPDSFALTGAIRSILPGAVVSRANDDAEVGRELSSRAATPTIFLVNRVLDGSFRSDHGAAMAATIRAGAPGAAVMLVSNRPEAHAEARAIGAMQGFGKAQLYGPAMREALRAAAGHAGWAIHAAEPATGRPGGGTP